MELKKKLVLKILAYVESHADGEAMCAPEFADYDERQINYHVEMCVQAGLLKVEDVAPPYIGSIKGLTWEGHQALASMRGKPLNWSPPE